MEGIRGHIHPLQDPDILEHIFKDLRVTDLFECRQVCRAWRQGTTKAMQTAVKARIDWNRDGQGLPEFLELIQTEWSTFSESPFVNTFELWDGVVNNLEFFNFCGSLIKSLKIIGFTFPNAKILCDIIVFSCPNLEHLELFHVEVVEKRPFDTTDMTALLAQLPPNFNLRSLSLRVLSGYIPWMEILGHFPSVEDLNVNISDSRAVDFFGSVLIHRFHNDNFWKLKKVKFTFDMFIGPRWALALFVEVNLALEELTINGVDSREIKIAVRRILAAHSGTLKKVHLSAGNDMECIFPLPGYVTLDKVQDLCLEFRTINPNFLVFVPNFKKLSLDVGVGGYYKNVGIDDVFVSTCTELVVLPIQHNKFRILCGWLPNLQALEMMGAGNEVFAVICELCPNLRSLCLDYCRVDDCGITGLDEGDVKKINRRGMGGDWRPITVPKANITNLKCLQKLKIKRDSGRKAIDICSIVCGVQKLPQLKCLNVTNREGSEEGEVAWGNLHIQYPWNTP